MEDKKILTIRYTNWKNETADRTVVPLEMWFGSTRWHPQEQWLLKAMDVIKNEERDFAMSSITLISGPKVAQENESPQIATKSPSKNLQEVKLFTDGGSRGNPGPSAIGFAIFDMNDSVIEQSSKYLGITTNNQAEYLGLKEGLEACRTMNIRTVHVHMDSLLVVNQMKGIYKVKNRDLWPIYDAVSTMLSNFSEVTFTHVPRELNKIADAMVNECLDAQ